MLLLFFNRCSSERENSAYNAPQPTHTHKHLFPSIDHSVTSLVKKKKKKLLAHHIENKE